MGGKSAARRPPAEDAVHATLTTYDALGNQLTESNARYAANDPNYRPTTYTYDELGRQTTKTLPDGEKTSTYYDGYGHALLTETYAAGATSAEVSIQDVYQDTANNPDKVSFEYRSLGDWLKSGNTLPISESSEIDYNDGSQSSVSAGAVIEVADSVTGSLASNHDDKYTYDPATGNVATIISTEGTIHYAYDPVTGWHVRTWVTHGASTAITNDTVYAYDSQGRLTNVYTLTLNGTTMATYNGWNSLLHQPNAFTGTPLTTTYTYDWDGNLHSETLPNGVQTQYAYNSLNQLTDVTTTNSAGVLIFKQHYDVRADGLRNFVVDTRYNSDGTMFSQTTTNWTYDADDRLIGEQLTANFGGSNAPTPYTTTYTLDLDGNRYTMQTVQNGSTVTINDRYNYDDQLSTETDGSTYDASYSYNAEGSQINKTVKSHGTQTVTESDTYTWDLRQRMVQLVSVLTPAGGSSTTTTTTYAYDENSVRVGEKTGGTSTYYLNDPQNPTGYAKAVEESASLNSAPARSYILGHEVIGQGTTSGTTPVYLLHDGRGDTRALLDVAASLQEQYNFDAYGNLLSSAGAQGNAAAAKTPWLLPDGLYDPASGMNYHLRRWQQQARFISADDPGYETFGQPLTSDLYAYVGGNPIIHSDPNGHDFTLLEATVTGAIIGGVAGGIGGAVYAKAYKHTELFSWETARYTIEGAVGGALVGAFAGAAVFVASGGSAAGLLDTLQTGLRGYLSKWSGPLGTFNHPTTLAAGSVGFVLGLVYGWEHPSAKVELEAAVGVAAAFATDIVTRGILLNRHSLIPTFAGPGIG